MAQKIPAKVVVCIAYENGAKRSVLWNGKNYQGRDANGKTYRVNDETAAKMVRGFDEDCNELRAKLVEIDDEHVSWMRVAMRSMFA